MRAQRNNYNAHLQQKQVAGPLARKTVQLTVRVMALVRGASMSTIVGMDRGIPLLGIIPTKLLKSLALRITSMPVASAPLFSGRTGSRNQSAPTIRGLDGLLVCSMYRSLNEEERRAGTISSLKRENC
jgi:hypothetical protein